MAAPPARPHIIPQQTRSFLWGSRGLSSSTSNDWGWQDDMDDDTWDSTSDQEDQGKKGFTNKIGSGLKVKKNDDAPPSSSTGSSPNDNAPHSSASSTTPIPLANGRPSAGARGTSSRLLAGQTSTGGGAGTDHGGGSISSGNISFSFTHVDAPSPSSYPLKESVLAPSPSRQPTLTHKPSNLGESNASTDDEMARKAAGWTIISHDLASANRLARDKRLRKESGKGGGDDDGEPAVHMNEEEEGGKGERDGESEIILGELELEDRVPQMARKRIGFGNEAIKLFAEDILKDPFFRVRQSSEFRQSAAAALSPPVQSVATFSTSSVDLSRSRTQPVQDKADRKAEKFEDCLLKEDVEMTTLRKLAWNGIPDFLRPAAWPLLLGYLPLSSSARLVALNRKREEYRNLVNLTFKRGKEGLDQQIWHQIEIDVPRTRPGVRLWMMEGTQRSLERILYVWAIRHPASGYVQGINDLVTPFYEVFLSAYIDGDPEEFDPAALPPHMLSAVEADSFWCLSRLLDGIQENYIQHQPGIQKSVKRMRELVGRIDPALAAHLDSEGVEFMQFAFRWMNCLLMREISVKNTIRMWDTYLAEGPDAFSQFHLYVCCAFLVRWSDKLRQMDFQGIIMFLQSLPTEGWGDEEIEMLLSQSFVLSSTWANAQNHFS